MKTTLIVAQTLFTWFLLLFALTGKKIICLTFWFADGRKECVVLSTELFIAASCLAVINLLFIYFLSIHWIKKTFFYISNIIVLFVVIVVFLAGASA